MSQPLFHAIARRTSLAACMFCACAATVLVPRSPAAAQASPATSEPMRESRDEAVLRLLETTIVDAQYDRVDFEKIIQDLRDRFKLNILVSWSAIEALGVRRDVRIEMKLSQITLASLLDLLLREAAAGTRAAGELTYHVEAGVIVIDTGERRSEERVLRMYDVTDLLESGYELRRFANTPVLGMKLTGREFVGGEKPQDPSSGFGGGGGGMGGGGAGAVFGEPGDDPEHISVMERIAQIVNLVQENVDPSGWEDLGGDVGSIRALNSTLIVQNTLRNHQKIAAFLAAVRESRPQSLSADVAIVRLRSDKAAELRRAAGDGFPRLPGDALSQMAFAPEASGVLFRATGAGAAGQRMWFSALTQREAVVSAHAIVGDGASAYFPVSQTATAGLELIVLPLLAPGAERMTLDVQMALVPPTSVQPRTVRLGPGEAESSIDQVQRSMRTVSSQTSLTLGETIAMSIPQELNPEGAAAEYEDWLLVRVRKAP